MPVEKDDGWVARQLSDHADRRQLDLDAFVTRVLSEVDASPRALKPSRTSSPPTGVGVERGRRVSVRGSGPADRKAWEPARRRLLPLMVAAISVLAVAVAASSGSAVARWAAGDEGTAAVRPAPSPTSTNPSTIPSPAPSASQSREPAQSTPAPTASTALPTPGARREGNTLPSTFRWRSGGPLLPARVDADGVTGVKDPSVVRHGGKWHVFVTTVNDSGYGLGYLSFNRWSDASTARLHSLGSSAIGAGYRATPQVFYFAPQKLWYLVYQTGTASYSTNPDISDPDGWSAPKDFYAGVPDLVRANLDGGGWVSMWVICDKRDCYLFSSDNRGHLFRSQTSRTRFPHGVSQPVVAVDGSRQGTSLAASHVYRVAGTGQYLLLGQAFGGDGKGYLRSWTASRLNGPWTPQAGSPPRPFAGASNVTFAAPAWTSHIVDGELVRDGYDENLSVSPCRLQLIYLGLDPRFRGNRAFGLGRLTQTNSQCG
jgi:hypothetical protein